MLAAKKGNRNLTGTRPLPPVLGQQGNLKESLTLATVIPKSFLFAVPAQRGQVHSDPQGGDKNSISQKVPEVVTPRRDVATEAFYSGTPASLSEQG